MISGLVLCFSVYGLCGGTSAFAEDCDKAAKYCQYAEQKLTDLAEKRYAFRQAVDLCPSYLAARVKLANTARQLAALAMTDREAHNKFLDEAASEYETAVKQDPHLFNVHLELAKIYSLQCRYPMAKQSYCEALKIKPDDRTAKSRLEAVEEEMAREKGGFKKAEEIVEAYKQSACVRGTIKKMGIEEFTVPKDRQRFSNVLFDEWSCEIKSKESAAQIEQIGKALSCPEMSELRFVVEGHTDKRGDMERNRVLSERRAESVKKRLVEQFRIDPERIATRGFGISRPRVPNDSDEHMRENRRVEIVFFE